MPQTVVALYVQASVSFEARQEKSNQESPRHGTQPDTAAFYFPQEFERRRFGSLRRRPTGAGPGRRSPGPVLRDRRGHCHRHQARRAQPAGHPDFDHGADRRHDRGAGFQEVGRLLRPDSQPDLRPRGAGRQQRDHARLRHFRLHLRRQPHHRRIPGRTAHHGVGLQPGPAAGRHRARRSAGRPARHHLRRCVAMRHAAHHHQQADAGREQRLGRPDRHFRGAGRSGLRRQRHAERGPRRDGGIPTGRLLGRGCRLHRQRAQPQPARHF